MEKETLPIHRYRKEIEEAVETHSVVIITAETGAGKSTQVPQFLMEMGYQVLVTQPRRLAARIVAERVAEEVGCRFGGAVGYCTRYERLDSSNTQVLFCTDGFQLIREITGKDRVQVLVIDEVHEWNINIETLVAWTRKQIVEGWDVKVVLMGAMLEADKLAAFYGENVSVIEVPGRIFPVEINEDLGCTLVSNIKKLIEEGRNVLVFQPGKKEVIEVCLLLEGCNAEVLPLYSQLEPADQKKCFRTNYGRPKVVVATNVAQTSITIPGIDAVVDSGLERRVELVDGVEGLYLKPVSQVGCLQRKDSAGRMKQGIYILCSDTLLSDRPAVLQVEVERSRLDQLVLRLANVGIDATELSFFHKLDNSALREAKRALYVLGAITSEGLVTKIGYKMAKFPVSVQFARMIVEANKRGVVDDVLTIIAILKIGSIRYRNGDWRMFTDETESDLIAELNLWQAARGKSNQELRDMGLFASSYWRVKEFRRNISQSIRGFVQFGSSGDCESIKRSCLVGMVDHLYRKVGYDIYWNSGDGDRRKARESVVSGDSDWLVGIPKNLLVQSRRSGDISTLYLVDMCTNVDPMWLAELVPHLLTIEDAITFGCDYDKDACVLTTKMYFNGQQIKEKRVVG